MHKKVFFIPGSNSSGTPFQDMYTRTFNLNSCELHIASWLPLQSPPDPSLPACHQMALGAYKVADWQADLCPLTWKNALGLNFRLPKCHYLKWKSFTRHSTNFSRLYVTYLGCGEEMRHMWIVHAHPPFQVWSPLSLASTFPDRLTSLLLPSPPLPLPLIYSVDLTEIHLFYPPPLLRAKGPLWESLHLF